MERLGDTKNYIFIRLKNNNTLSIHFVKNISLKILHT